MACITELAVYPIKSCGGINVQSALMTPQGLAYDRRWMVVDEATGRALTQRQIPRMARIKVELPPAVIAGAAPGAGDALVLSAGGVDGRVEVPLVIDGTPELREAKVWAWSGVAADEGDAAADWLSAYLGKRARLVRYLGSLDPASDDAAAALAAKAVVAGGGAAGADAGARAALTRAVDGDFAPWEPEVAFADGFAVLVATTESLQDLNSRLDGPPVKMNRFRPNIILSGAGPAWADDGFGVIRLGGGGAPGDAGDAPGDAGDAGGAGGGVEVAMVKPCSRCTVPLVDQETGEVPSKEPIKTMQAFRTGRALGFDNKYGGQGVTFFAQNGQPLGTAVVRVGDAAAVVKMGSYAAAA